MSQPDRRRTPRNVEPAPCTLPVLGTSCDLLHLVQEQHVPEVILAISHSLSTPLFQVLLDCKEQGVQITLMPVLFEQLTGQVPIEHIGDNWNIALPLDSAEASGFYALLKRVFDVTGALVGLILFGLLFPAIALAIRLNSSGPILYSQERVGKGGKCFNLLKLRTMVTNAEEDGHAQRARANDPRITSVGLWLRKMRLDEMPQLDNVLKGEMSAVGPRPERPEHLAELDRVIPFHRLRNAVKPGMAGWAAVATVLFVVVIGVIVLANAIRVVREYDRLAEKYGEKRADRIVRLSIKHYTRLALIDTGRADMARYREYAQALAQRWDLRFEAIPGSNELVRRMLFGPWNRDFVVIGPDDTIRLEHFLDKQTEGTAA